MLEMLPALSDKDIVPTPDSESGFGTLRTEKGALPLVALNVRARLDGLIAAIELTQTFINSHDQPLEATYIFPLPDRAAVTSFRLEVAGRVVEGELQERGQARRTYDAAIQAGHRAAIAEEERPGVFTMRVGNLPPGEQAVVRLTLAGPLPYSDGEVTFRFPLVVAPRYIPGSVMSGPAAGSGIAADTDLVPDASRISPPVLLPGFPNPVRLSICVEVPDSSLKPRAFRSSLHTVIEEKTGESQRFRVTPGERLDRDFILRWRLAGDGIGTSLAVKPDETGNEGTFLLTVVPPAHLEERNRPRDIVFVLDRSGSMSGWKMVAARRAVSRLVEALTEHDRFSVYAFDDNIETPPGFDGVALVPASDRQRFRAGEFLSRIDARGGTEMAVPLRKAVEELNRSGPDANVDRVLVLITDGQVGNEDHILRTIGASASNIRIFTLGIDRAVNAAFLRRLADMGRGVSEVVESEQRLDEVMDQIHRHVGTPLLTSLSVASAGLDIVAESMVPARLPDLFAGAPVVISGRYRGSAHGAVVLRGLDAQGEKWASEVMSCTQEKSPLDRIWGRGRVRELEDRYAVQAAGRAQLEREIVATSLRCGVLSRFTAYVAVDRSEVVNRGGEQTKVTQAVEQPAGWGQMESLAMQAAPPAPAASPTASWSADAGPASSALAMPVRAKRAYRGIGGGSERRSQARQAEEEAPRDEACATIMPSGGDKNRAKSNTASEEHSEVVSKFTGDKAEGGSVWAWIKSFFGVTESKPKQNATADRQAVRARAEALLLLLESVGNDAVARLRVLRATETQLNELVRDILTTGESSDALLELSKQVSGLKQVVEQASPPDDVVNRTHEGILVALRAWLGQPTGTTGGTGREGFWK